MTYLQNDRWLCVDSLHHPVPKAAIRLPVAAKESTFPKRECEIPNSGKPSGQPQAGGWTRPSLVALRGKLRVSSSIALPRAQPNTPAGCLWAVTCFSG